MQSLSARSLSWQDVLASDWLAAVIGVVPGSIAAATGHHTMRRETSLTRAALRLSALTAEVTVDISQAFAATGLPSVLP